MKGLPKFTATFSKQTGEEETLAIVCVGNTPAELHAALGVAYGAAESRMREVNRRIVENAADHQRVKAREVFAAAAERGVAGAEALLAAAGGANGDVPAEPADAPGNP